MELLKDVQLNEDEKVIKIIRHHSIIVVPHIIISFVILVLDFFMMYYLFLQGWWGVVLFLLVLFMVFFYIARLIFLFKKNKFIITNQRIIDYEQATFFEKYINDFPFSKIKEVTVNGKGIFPAIFKYGSLKIVLKNDVAPYELFKVPVPVNLQSQINNLLFKDKEKELSVKKISQTTDPVTLIMAEVDLLPIEQKIEIMKEIRTQLKENEE